MSTDSQVAIYALHSSEINYGSDEAMPRLDH